MRLRPISGSFVLVLTFGAAPALASAQTQYQETWLEGSQTEAGSPSSAVKRVEALHVTDGTPTIDGRLDDSIWQGARWISDFQQRDPTLGAPPTVGTAVAFAYDDDALYVAARMESSAQVPVYDLMTRRDQPGNAERLIVSLDTYHDRRTAYSFAVTAAGVRIDYFHPEDNDIFDLRDFTFDPVWSARTEVTGSGWTAEMRIPFSQLRFNRGSEQIWGVNVNRYIPSINEDDFWIVVPYDETGWASRFGELVGIRDIPPSRRIELTPYVSSSAAVRSEALLDVGDPFGDTSDMDGRTGLDLKMGLGPNLTLDAAINPDFGQVEADPAVVNLSAFEVFFPERRPFFTQGQQNFTGAGPVYYYSRRIGATPRGLDGDGAVLSSLDGEVDFNEVAPTTTILGAAKITGRLPSGLTVGGLAALTAEENVEAFDQETSAFRDVRVEPRTAYGVLRLQQQIGHNASTLGLTLTGVERDLDVETPLAGRLADRAITGGLDWNKRFTGGWYEILGHVGFSHVQGDSEAIRRLQENNVHRFQRPDQDHVEVDPDATSLSGWSAALRGGKRTGTWQWNHGLRFTSPGFEINDVGQLGRADDIYGWGGLSYNVTEPGKLLRRWNAGLFTNNNWNFGGIHRFTNVGGYVNWTLPNFVNGFFEYIREDASQFDFETRGGPLLRYQGGWVTSGGVFSNFNAPTGWGLRYVAWQDGWDDAWMYRVDPEFRWQASDRLRLTFIPRWHRERHGRTFIDIFEGGRPETFGSRYVFGRIDRSEMAAPVRINYSFSPDLNLELYAEPFAASGKYFGIGELERPAAEYLIVYGQAEGTTLERDAEGDYTVGFGDQTFSFDNPDFNVLSFRSNLVLRWEWRPGSALFVVWQQNREADNTVGRLVDPNDVFDSLTAHGENVLAVKLTYWMPL